MTITSGIAQVGKTHLAVNLALELTRRGRRAGIYHELDTPCPVDALLALPHALTQRRRTTDRRGATDFICRGYLGSDILSSLQPLRDWAGGEAQRQVDFLAVLQSQPAYDDVFIDTSGMEPRSLIACCRASARVILVLTPEVHSQAEAFALLKVLVLNGYAGELWLLVNRTPDVQTARAIQQRFNAQVQAHLGGEVPLLGSIPEDPRVGRAQEYLQAYSAIFPDCEAAVAIGSLAGALPEAPAGDAGQRSLEHFWRRFLDIMQEPVHVAGNELLQESAAADSGRAPDAGEEVASAEVNLLALEGELVNLPGVVERAAESLQSASQLLAGFAARLDEVQPILPETAATQLESSQLPAAAVQLLAALAGDVPRAAVALRVDSVSVGSAEGDWLRPGRYLKYTLQLAAVPAAAQSQLQALLPDIPVQEALPGVAEDTLREVLTERHDGCLDVLTSATGAVRIQVWLPLAAAAPAALQPPDNVRVHKRLH